MEWRVKCGVEGQVWGGGPSVGWRAERGYRRAKCGMEG